MDKENFKKAEPIIENIEAIDELVKTHTLGKVSENNVFTENNDDFYGANLFNIMHKKAYHNTGGGSSDLSRIAIYEYSDKSGARYDLTKQEIIKLQNFVGKMLLDRKYELSAELSKI